MSKTLIIVPMKDPSASKTRLADALPEAVRTRLVRLLYRRCLSFLAPLAIELAADLAVVTRSPIARSIAEGLNVTVIDEPRGAGLSGAVSYAASVARQQGYARLCVIPADLVAPKRADLRRFLHSDVAVTVCPSTDLGTNALLVSPPDAIPFRYGKRSASLHLQEAQNRGLEACMMRLDSLSFDMDTTTCLARAIRAEPEIARAIA
ncbi:2-phospho-L-lactate guanylyltransferase [Cognatishimia activa]|uniref:2-phospho-L-lactate guanylyltransferase n=1 Tax=Cognatishimia activa TaxID=1715691 RepID=A0A0P1JDK7_9RHOB|nr:2-phospho-L-lactate guanylyltransferase [Cognatishimia activa]CUK27442.1 2-phospho-L-lactate guanylyltransferase [Cognatishimia activa]